MNSSSLGNLKSTGLFDGDDTDADDAVCDHGETETSKEENNTSLDQASCDSVDIDGTSRIDPSAQNSQRLPPRDRTTKRQKLTAPPKNPVRKRTTGAAKRKRSQAAALDRSKPFQPIRDYYHSTSFIKFKDNEWENDVDSDDEVDHSWRRGLEKSELQEFTDIPNVEKDLMQMWNAFVRSDTIIRKKSIPQKCLNFIDMNATTIRDEGLGEQLPWHLINLWDEGLISSDHMSVCLDRYHKLAGGT